MFTHPVEFQKISSGYGYRTDPFTGKKGFHNGIDYLVAIGTPVRSSLNGIVLKTNYMNTGYGLNVLIDHLNGFYTVYGHLSEILVMPNQNVKQGQIIGMSGDSGRSTGAHLHFAIKENNRFIDPVKVLEYPKPLPASVVIASNPNLIFIPLFLFLLLKKS
jgi:murein DD-endopeptidase MepM/ murein hydrolase activator NlpD